MFRHTMLFLGYELGNVRRNPVWPLFGLMQPILYLLLFAPLLTGSVIVMSAVFTILTVIPPYQMWCVKTPKA